MKPVLRRLSLYLVLTLLPLLAACHDDEKSPPPPTGATPVKTFPSPGPVSPYMTVSVQLEQSTTDTALVLDIAGQRLPLLRADSSARLWRGVLPPMTAGNKQAEVRSATGSFVASGSIQVVDSVRAVDSLGNALLARMVAALDTLDLVSTTLGRFPLPRGDSLRLAAMLRAGDDARAALRGTLAKASSEQRLAFARMLVPHAARFDSALSTLMKGARTQLQTLPTTIAVARVRTQLDRNVSSAASGSSGAYSMSLCVSIVRDIEGSISQFASALGDAVLALEVIAAAMSEALLAYFAGSLGIGAGFATVLAMVGMIAAAFAVVTSISAIMIDLASWIYITSSSARFVPIAGPNAKLVFSPPKHRAGGAPTSATSVITVGPLGARLSQIIARSVALVGAIVSARAMFDRVKSATTFALNLLPFGKDLLEPIAQQIFDAIVKGNQAIDNLLASDDGSGSFFTEERPLLLDADVQVSPLTSPIGAWELAVAGSGATFSSTEAAANIGKVDFSLTGGATVPATDPLATEVAALCRVAGVAPTDDGVNRIRVDPPEPRIVIEATMRAEQTKEFYRVSQEKTYALAPGASGSWSLEVETTKAQNPNQFGKAINQGSLADSKSSFTLAAQQTWDHPGGNTWNWSGFSASVSYGIWIEAIASSDAVWLMFSGSSSIDKPNNANGYVQTSKGRRNLVNESFADSVRLTRINNVTRLINGRLYYPYTALAALVSTGFGETCIINACGRPAFLETPRAELKLDLQVKFVSTSK